jgi:hypothetical protein
VRSASTSRTCAAHSGNLQLSNAGNSYFGEYLYRAKGDAGDQLTYKTDSPARSVRIWAWKADDKVCLRIAAAADGEDYTPIDVLPQTTVYTSNRGDRKATQVQLLAELPERTRFVQIEWLGPAQVDRVEIRHSGASTGPGQSGYGVTNER